MRTSAGHLTYCTNIHAGESWPDHFSALKRNFPAIKSEISPGALMGIGLRLSHVASLELVKTERVAEFKQWLKESDAYVFTMNGFPYGGFHNTRVKDNVHAPDWTTRDRVEYTKRLFDILAELLPEGMDGGVSTSPLSYRYWFAAPAELANATEVATKHVLEVAEHLIKISNATGKMVHLDIEPEPDGILETGEEFIEWFQNHLLPVGNKQIAARFSVSEDEAQKLIKQHVALCYDVCHFAIGYEPHAKVIDKLAELGIKVGKIQISAALKAPLGKADDRAKIKDAFSRFNEPTYLHQVVGYTSSGELVRYRDLPEALQDVDNTAVKEWRAHFHVPVFQEDFGMVQSTQGDICEVLEIQKNKDFTSHLEVETYTWEVLPDASKLPIEKSISRELRWIADQLS